jgi:hypothetical protein
MHTFSLSSKDSELHGGPGGGISAFEQEPLDASGWFDEESLARRTCIRNLLVYAFPSLSNLPVPVNKHPTSNIEH